MVILLCDLNKVHRWSGNVASDGKHPAHTCEEQAPAEKEQSSLPRADQSHPVPRESNQGVRGRLRQVSGHDQVVAQRYVSSRVEYFFA